MQIIYIILNFISLITIGILGLVSYKNKDENYSKYFMYSMIFMMVWTIGTILELSTSNFYSKVFFPKYSSNWDGICFYIRLLVCYIVYRVR